MSAHTNSSRQRRQALLGNISLKATEQLWVMARGSISSAHVRTQRLLLAPRMAACYIPLSAVATLWTRTHGSQKAPMSAGQSVNLPACLSVYVRMYVSVCAHMSVQACLYYAPAGCHAALPCPLTRMTGCTAEDPSGMHISSRPMSRCIFGRCCSSSVAEQSFSLMLPAAGAAAAAGPPVGPAPGYGP